MAERINSLRLRSSLNEPCGPLKRRLTKEQRRSRAIFSRHRYPLDVAIGPIQAGSSSNVFHCTAKRNMLPKMIGERKELGCGSTSSSGEEPAVSPNSICLDPHCAECWGVAIRAHAGPGFVGSREHLPIPAGAVSVTDMRSRLVVLNERLHFFFNMRVQHLMTRASPSEEADRVQLDEVADQSMEHIADRMRQDYRKMSFPPALFEPGRGWEDKWYKSNHVVDLTLSWLGIEAVKNPSKARAYAQAVLRQITSKIRSLNRNGYVPTGFLKIHMKELEEIASGSLDPVADVKESIHAASQVI